VVFRAEISFVKMPRNTSKKAAKKARQRTARKLKRKALEIADL
jgi:hypothetical protein